MKKQWQVLGEKEEMEGKIVKIFMLMLGILALMFSLPLFQEKIRYRQMLPERWVGVVCVWFSCYCFGDMYTSIHKCIQLYNAQENVIPNSQ